MMLGEQETWVLLPIDGDLTLGAAQRSLVGTRGVAATKCIYLLTL